MAQTLPALTRIRSLAPIADLSVEHVGLDTESWKTPNSLDCNTSKERSWATKCGNACSKSGVTLCLLRQDLCTQVQYYRVPRVLADGVVAKHCCNMLRATPACSAAYHHERFPDRTRSNTSFTPSWRASSDPVSPSPV